MHAEIMFKQSNVVAGRLGVTCRAKKNEVKIHIYAKE